MASVAQRVGDSVNLEQYVREIVVLICGDVEAIDPEDSAALLPILQRLRDEVLEEAATVASRRRAGLAGNCNPSCHDVSAWEIRARKVSQ